MSFKTAQRASTLHEAGLKNSPTPGYGTGFSLHVTSNGAYLFSRDTP